MASSKILLALLISSALTACGGGGGGGGGSGPVIEHPDPIVAVGTAGVYDVNYGQFHGTYTLLDNGAFYGVHFVGTSELAGHPHGQLTAANSAGNLEAISWANFIDDASQVGRQEAAGRFGRSFAAASLDVAISGSMGNFSASTNTQKLYGDHSAKSLYLDPIALTALAGNYRGQIRTAGISKPKEAVVGFAIDASGNLTASAVGCTFSGKLIQHGSTGIYDLQLATAGAGCTLNPVLKGVVTPLSFIGGIAQLAVQVDSVDNAHSAVFIVTKS